jgi:hypothetical protein
MASAPPKTQNLSYEAFFNFAIKKIGKHGGKELHRILSFDFKGQKINNIEKENINKSFPFGELVSAKTGGLNIHIQFTKNRDLKAQGQSPQDVEYLALLINRIANKQPLELEKRDRRVLYAGHVLKYGHSFSGFDNRFLVLVPGKLFVFGGKVGSDSYTAFPRNIVAVDNAGIALLGDGLSFNLKFGKDCSEVLPLYCPTKEAREHWYAALKLSAQKCKNGIAMLPDKAKPEEEKKDEPKPEPEPEPPKAEEISLERSESSADGGVDTDDEEPKAKVDYGDGEDGHTEPHVEEAAEPAPTPEAAKPKKRASLIAPEDMAALEAAAKAEEAPAPAEPKESEWDEEDKMLAQLQNAMKTEAAGPEKQNQHAVLQKQATMTSMKDSDKKTAFEFWRSMESTATTERL